MQIFNSLKLFLKYRTQKMGFHSFLDEQLSGDEINIIASKVYISELEKHNRTHLDIIFERRILISNYDAQCLKKMYEKKLIRTDQLIFMKFCRALYNLYGFFELLTFFNKNYLFQLRLFGNIKSQEIILVYSKNKSREKHFYKNNSFRINDYLIDLKPAKDFKTINSIKVNLKLLLEAFCIKSNYFFLPTPDIIEVLVARHFFDNELSTKDNKIIGSLQREAPVAISRVIIEACNKYNIKSSVYYTQLILPTQDLPQIELAPTKATNFILSSSRFMPKGITKNHKVDILNSYPFDNWKKLSNDLSSTYVFGIQLGDDWFRWRRQEKVDRLILETLKEIGIKECIGRPHPIELTINHRVKYYQELQEKYPFLKLDLSSYHDSFFKEISCLISYVPSTLVQQALLCKRQVIIVEPQEFTHVNSSAISISHGLAKACFGGKDLKVIINEFKSMSSSEKDKSWHGYLDELGIDKDLEINVDDFLQLAFEKNINV